eukprot:1193353-Prorocentrum_minimum.AAC.2
MLPSLASMPSSSFSSRRVTVTPVCAVKSCRQRFASWGSGTSQGLADSSRSSVFSRCWVASARVENTEPMNTEPKVRRRVIVFVRSKGIRK